MPITTTCAAKRDDMWYKRSIHARIEGSAAGMVGAYASSGIFSSTERAASAARAAIILCRCPGRRICEIYLSLIRYAANVACRAWRCASRWVAINCRRICARRARTTHAGWAIPSTSSATWRSHTRGSGTSAPPTTPRRQRMQRGPEPLAQTRWICAFVALNLQARRWRKRINRIAKIIRSTHFVKQIRSRKP